MNIIQKAREFAHAAHDSIKQVRKYTGEPYWVHTDEVAGIVMDIVLPVGGKNFSKQDFIRADNMIAAAHLHDVEEDVHSAKYNRLTIYDLFGMEVGYMVDDLTDKFTSENYPNLNRKERKRSEAIRLGMIPNDSKTIKLADLLSNTKSIVEHDKGFARTYLNEKEHLLPLLRGGNQDLWDRVNNQLKNSLLLLALNE